MQNNTSSPKPTQSITNATFEELIDEDESSSNICPSCGSENLSYGIFELDKDYKFNACFVDCMDCNCSFQQVYELFYLETEMYLDDNILYSSDEDLCPSCSSDKIAYIGCDFDEDQLINYIACRCENCDNTDQDNEDSGFDFQQIYELNFLKSAIISNEIEAK